MKLLLVKCRTEEAGSVACCPPLGLLSLAAVARKCGWDVRLFDAYLHRRPEAALESLARRWQPVVVGLSAITCEHRSLHRLARAARRGAPGALVVAGGPHPTVYPHRTLADPALDAVVLGEGELTMEQLLEQVAGGGRGSGLPGLASRRGEEVSIGPPRAVISDLDTLPFPAWDLADVDAYSRRPGMDYTGLRRYMGLLSSRGCPYECVYCHNLHGKAYRTHSPEYVLGMIRELSGRYGIHDFDFFDDIFNLDGPRMERILEGIASGPEIRFSFPNGLRGDLLSAEQIRLLKVAGCQHVFVAVETASPRLQREIGKRNDLPRLDAAIDALTRQRIFTTGYFMLGFPTETEQEMRRTVDFALASRLHVAFFYTVVPIQGTALQQYQQPPGEHLPAGGEAAYFLEQQNLSLVPNRRFSSIKQQAYLRFYGHPRRVARILRDIPQRGSLPRNLLRVLRYGLG